MVPVLTATDSAPSASFVVLVFPISSSATLSLPSPYGCVAELHHLVGQQAGSLACGEHRPFSSGSVNGVCRWGGNAPAVTLWMSI